MRLFSKVLNIFSKKSLQTRPVAQMIPLQPGSFLEYVFSDQDRITNNQAMIFYRKNSSISTAVDKIATACEQIVPVLKLPDGKIETNHEVITRLKSPNFLETYRVFLGQLIRHYLLTHNAYINLLGSVDREPLQTYIIKPQNVSTYQSSFDGYPSRYSIANISPGRGNYDRVEKNMTARFLANEFNELYHIMGFSSEAINIHADSPLDAIALEIRQQIAGKHHNISVLNNGGRLSLVVYFKDKEAPDPDEFRERQQLVREAFAGSGNAGKIAVMMGEDVEIKEVGKTNKDMDFLNLDEVAKNVIYLKFGVPLPLISLDASTYNNIENAIFNFFENTVLPVFSTVMEGLSKVLMPRYNLEFPDYILTYDASSIPVIMRQKLLEIKTRKEINVETPNGLRSLLGKDKIDGGEVIYQPSTLVPMSAEQTELTDDEINRIVEQNESQDA